jgi:predicted aldo/keto reductase-like oxidoreductase
MQEMRLGRTGLTVTRLGMGGIQLLKMSGDEAERVVRTGLDLGVNFLETARAYGDSEEKIGRAIRGRREGLVLATKARAESAGEMAEEIDASLKTLGTDRIDLYQFHACDKRETYEGMIRAGGALEALLRAKDAGKIGAVGFSSHQLDLSLEMMDDARFTSVQLPISFMNTENHERNLFERAGQRDVGLIAMKPFGGGRLANARLCMGYALSLPNVAVAVGMDSVEHVRELASLAEHPPQLGEEDRREMERLREEVGTRFCRACNYCQPCPEDIKIYQGLWTPVYLAQIGSDRALTGKAVERVRDSQKCTECGECEERCPFDLDIVGALKECRARVERVLAERR